MSRKSIPREPKSDQQLILVDEYDNAIGQQEKYACHLDTGQLHRAFSALLFNDNNELLIQQRSEHKMLWPLFWSNSCCSHPCVGETMEQACERRIQEELSIRCDVQYVYKFQYFAQYLDVGAENEFCYVFIGKTNKKPKPDPDEIATIEYVPIEEVQQRLIEDSHLYTPWFKQEWAALRRHHWDQVKQLLK